MRFEFVVRNGPETGRTIALATGQALTFGRLKTCDVQLDDESVSRRHCTLRAQEQACVVSDLESANGTFVNDHRISTADLGPGDKLRVGSTVLELVSASLPEPRLAGRLTTTSLKLVGDERGQTLVRRAVDPGRLEFLTEVFKQQDEHGLLESAQRYLSTLHSVSDVLSRASGVEGLFDSILAAILDVTQGDRAAILMRDLDAPPEADVHVVAVRTRTGGGSTGTMILSRTVVRDVLDQGISTFTHDALSDERYGAGQSIVRQRIRSVMCAPMRTTGDILGVLYVDSHSAHEFNEAELELLAAIGNQAGIALHRARLLAEVEKLFLDVMKAIAAIIDAKDGYTHRHSERVAAFAVRLAHQLGWPPDECSVIELSGLLHDVGKIGISDAILNKPGKLTDEEFAEVRRHPGHGAAILSNIKSAKVAKLLPGVKYHHERWDGTGYPDGLKGEDIPVFGRVLAVADFVDALTSDRSYRTALSIDQVVAMIQDESGQAFDPSVVEAAVALHEKGELALPVAPAPSLR
ncbi:MAG TPA: HD domain-containing phosphohydrolase [Vicinamibacterales bacterium]|nr:HD domain-containing phosphohydrolase [Vicinamibacterales bacterium]